jgi:penicillin-binding protein 2
MALVPSSSDREPAESPPQTPQLALRVAVMGVVALALFGVLVFRLWAVQVLASPSYQTAAAANLVQHVTLPAWRGRILDTRGRVLVRNRPSLEVQVDTARLSTPALRAPVLRRLARVLGTTRRKLEATVAHDQLLYPLQPATVATDVDRSMAFFLGENARLFPGVSAVPQPLRYYPGVRVGSHLYGLLVPISAAQLRDKVHYGCYQPPHHCYGPDDIIGLGGVEGAYDKWLRGLDGRLNVKVDALGRPRGVAIPRPAPQSGYNLRLTIDERVQRAAEDALRRGVLRASPHGAQSGAIVAMDPSTGAIRALASYPDFNPNWIVSRNAPRYRWANHWLATSPLRPAFDRAIAGQYAPGSTFKPFVAAAALMEGLISPTSELHCTGSLRVSGTTFFNWDKGADQWMSLPTALEQSCDTFFYRLGKAFNDLPPARGSPLQSWAARFGFGRYTGIDIAGEVPGLLPTPSFKHHTFRKGTWDWDWHPGDSVNLAIGQGYLNVTPLQLARGYAAIANGGLLVTPHIAQDAELNGQVVEDFSRHPSRSVGLSPGALAAIREGLLAVTHNPLGTAYKVFGNFGVSVAGKTGTAQRPPHPDDSLFASYAPADNPKLVVVVVIQGGGHGGEAAAPTAADFYCHYFKHVACPSFAGVQDNSR